MSMPELSFRVPDKMLDSITRILAEAYGWYIDVAEALTMTLVVYLMLIKRPSLVITVWLPGGFVDEVRMWLAVSLWLLKSFYISRS